MTMEVMLMMMMMKRRMRKKKKVMSKARRSDGEQQRLTAHPGFSKEVEPSQPRVTTALPTDFEFQHSCDKDDNMTEKNLAAGTSSDDDNMIQNCCTHNSLSGTIPEILTASLVQWLESSQQVKGNIWPDYKPEMAKLLFEDLSTWCSDLKRITISITPSMYDLVLPSHVPPQECATWVKEHAAKLLELSLFLCNGVDSLGKTRNIAHPALHKATILFFYTGSYCIACRRPEVFHEQLPLECLALVCTVFNCVLDGLVKNGNGKLYPKFSAKEYKSI
ncbi:uncharacterized protein HD556DRAFT_1443965 [Suillus plorans]|uniref:DUF6532 domain-containing protein n=1 Tax=Suillus plorans TaxID=116603 RepID=A0A9P7AN95_9AGAM|nr:uncharacterized protein HD556DRAFT_1443965 [Suillus plorans]KAG1792882.1 hypothetical protein HD556DRAFT_1443965 [Suillus plorans]